MIENFMGSANFFIGVRNYVSARFVSSYLKSDVCYSLYWSSNFSEFKNFVEKLCGPYSNVAPDAACSTNSSASYMSLYLFALKLIIVKEPCSARKSELFFIKFCVVGKVFKIEKWIRNFDANNYIPNYIFLNFKKFLDLYNTWGSWPHSFFMMLLHSEHA